MIITKWRLFEKKSEETKKDKLIKQFDKEYGIELDDKFDVKHIEIIKKGLSYYNKQFIKNRIDKIIYKDLGGVHGRWHDSPKKKHMTLNPSIFDFKKEFENGTEDLPYKIFVIVHEIAHCIDHIEKVSFSKTWQAISGWKKCDISDKIPDGYDRYIEKRKGREIAGPKKSGWVYKEGSDFCRKYSSRNPREDFADSLAFVIMGAEEKLKGEGGQKKLEIIKTLLKKIK